MSGLEERLTNDLTGLADAAEFRPEAAAAIARTVHHRRRTRRLRQVALVAAVGAVLGGIAVRQVNEGDDVSTGEDPAPTTVTIAPTTTDVPSTQASTTVTTDQPVQDPTAECTRESVAASVGYRLDEVLSDPVCEAGWGWVDVCPASERSSEGCVHAGKIIRVVDDRWIVVTALLQDCAESFIAEGAPAAVAESFYPRCF